MNSYYYPHLTLGVTIKLNWHISNSSQIDSKGIYWYYKTISIEIIEWYDILFDLYISHVEISASYIPTLWLVNIIISNLNHILYYTFITWWNWLNSKWYFYLPILPYIWYINLQVYIPNSEIWIKWYFQHLFIVSIIMICVLYDLDMYILIW
jgi:hypothetical protein